MVESVHETTTVLAKDDERLTETRVDPHCRSCPLSLPLYRYYLIAWFQYSFDLNGFCEETDGESVLRDEDSQCRKVPCWRRSERRNFLLLGGGCEVFSKSWSIRSCNSFAGARHGIHAAILIHAVFPSTLFRAIFVHNDDVISVGGVPTTLAVTTIYKW